MALPINEIFNSIQGEGRWTGFPMTFVRLSGCNLKCEWCDQPDSVPIPGYELKFKKMTEQQIFQEVKKHMTRRVCITGGEPLVHDITELFWTLKLNRYIIHLETNCTRNTDLPFDHISVAPHGPYEQEMYDKADDIKFVVDQYFEPKQVMKSKKPTAQVFLQPCNDMHSINRESLDRVLHLLKNRADWALSVQLHKLMGVR